MIATLTPSLATPGATYHPKESSVSYASNSTCFRRRYGNFEDFLGRLDKVEGGICKFSESYKNMGCRVGADNTFVSTQWIPGAQARSKLSRFS